MVPSQPLVLLPIAILALSLLVFAEWLEGECTVDLQCEAIYHPGSKCLEGGRCSNPYIAGCLNNFQTYQNYQIGSKDVPEDTFPKRTCNSKDDNNENCEPSIFGYNEVRVHNGDWEASIFYSWIIQVFLSEFLQVEDSIQSSYAKDMPLTWSSKTYAWEELITANEMGGRCDLTDKKCVHVLPEVWNGQEKLWKNYLEKGHIDQLPGNGEIGKISLHIPSFTAQEYPDMVSFHGMSGNRERLASIFTRPTTWDDYCKFHSPTKCNKADGVAIRSPADEEEGKKYFLEGECTGCFHPTEKNDCSLNPKICSGHIVALPRSWDTNIDAQVYCNNISLEGDGPLPETMATLTNK